MNSVTSNAIAQLHKVNISVIKDFLDSTTSGTFTVQNTGWYYLYISNKSNSPNNYIYLYKTERSPINLICITNITGGGYAVNPVYLEKNTTYTYMKNAMTSTWVETACLKQ